MSTLDLLGVLRVPDCKYQKSYNRQEISDFILFYLNVSILTAIDTES